METKSQILLNELQLIHSTNEQLKQLVDGLTQKISQLENDVEYYRNSEKEILQENILLKDKIKKLNRKVKDLKSSQPIPELEFQISPFDLKKKPSLRKKSTKVRYSQSYPELIMNDDDIVSVSKSSSPSLTSSGGGGSRGPLPPLPKNQQQPKQQKQQLLNQNDDDIIISSDGKLSAASINKIIEILISPQVENQFQNIFLMTYRGFLSPASLFKKLEDSWANLIKNSKENNVDKLKFVNVIRLWLHEHPYDFTPDVIESLEMFISKYRDSIGETTCGIYIKSLNRLKKKTEKKTIESKLDIERPILPSSDYNEKDFIFVVDPLEIARQITLMDESIYKSIGPRECMNQAWNKPDRAKEQAPNIIKIIDKFNKDCGWVTKMIVQEPNQKKRKNIIIRIIKIAQKLREIHNYHSLMSLIAALESSPVTRMKKTWESVDSNYLKVFQELKNLMSAEGSYRNYRTVLKSESTPAIPYMGVYLGDLTFIEDGNPDNVMSLNNKKELINLLKMEMLSKVIGEIKMYQNSKYTYETVEKIQNILIELGNDQLTQQELFELSLKSEPRQQTTK